ncbi:hypothetical protein B0H13DRAFT_2393396 [Mycena leptocephala]|nr:hypothetical protein B0H13DRAFT_2393396 [Mycena leptocephala]
MAELGSAAPTAGGLYYWTFMFSSPNTARLCAGWLGVRPQFFQSHGGRGLERCTQIMAAANIGTDGAFVATNAQVYGVYCALLVIHAVMASLATKVIARLQHFFAFLNLALFLVVIIALPVATPKEFRNSAAFAFGRFQNTSGWGTALPSS